MKKKTIIKKKVASKKVVKPSRMVAPMQSPMQQGPMGMKKGGKVKKSKGKC